MQEAYLNTVQSLGAFYLVFFGLPVGLRHEEKRLVILFVRFHCRVTQLNLPWYGLVMGHERQGETGAKRVNPVQIK